MQMATNTSVSSRMTKGTDKAPSPMIMAKNMLVSTRMTKGTDKAPSPMIMAKNMLVFGRITSNMVKQYLLLLTVIKPNKHG